MAAEPVVLSHWYKLLEGLHASPLDFYVSIEHAVERRQVPEAARSRVDYLEGGIASARREYLRVQRHRLVLDICGAPFGNGFFVSWWLGEVRAGPAMLIGILTGTLFLVWIAFEIGVFVGILFFFLGIPAILLYLARNPPEQLAGWDDPILSIPFAGMVYERLFRPQTYYRIDTTLMFQQAVHSAVLEVVDDLLTAKGLRSLSEVERQPVLRDILRR